MLIVMIEKNDFCRLFEFFNPELLFISDSYWLLASILSPSIYEKIVPSFQKNTLPFKNISTFVSSSNF